MQSLRTVVRQAGLLQLHGSAVLRAPSAIVARNLSAQGSEQSAKQSQAASPAGIQTPDKTDTTWTEVVHEATGQTYWWNESTGETTALGEPKPQSKGGQGSGSQSQETAQPTYNSRAEPQLPDRTGTYAAIGAVSGVFFGWASQFF